MSSHRGHQIHRRQVERRLTYTVDIPVPAEGGLGRRLDDMIRWCHDNLAADDWAQFSHAEHVPGQAPRDFVRFRFLDDDAAGRFREMWGSADS